MKHVTPMPEATCSIERPTPCDLMPEVTDMVACPIFMSHMPNEALLSSSHSHDCHMRCSIFHSTYHHPLSYSTTDSMTAVEYSIYHSC